VSFLKSLFKSEDPTPQSEQDALEIKAFDAANAALDRAIAERQAADADLERRMNEPDRRKGGPDKRPPGSPDRRTSPQPRFGRRLTPE
jgi:hypothetical protein